MQQNLSKEAALAMASVIHLVARGVVGFSDLAVLAQTMTGLSGSRFSDFALAWKS